MLEATGQNRTFDAVRRQAAAMGCEVFEVFEPEAVGEPTIVNADLGSWLSAALRSLDAAAERNGRNIYDWRDWK
jgi:hypothetical protein